jgi:hypothetical protein
MSVKQIRLSILATALIAVAAPSLGEQAIPDNIVVAVGRYQGDSQAWSTLYGDHLFWNSATSWALPDVGQNAAPAFGDLDGDGDLDVLVGRSQGNAWAYENGGWNDLPSWQRKTAWDTPDIGAYAAPELADIDYDGDLDLVVGNSGGDVRVYQNTGSAVSPVWTRNKAWEIRTRSQYAVPRAAFLDDDGDLDLLVGTRFDGVKAYKNSGTALSPKWSYEPAWNGPSVGERTTVSLADMDEDGDVDLMLGDRAGDVLGYLNAGSVSSGPVWVSQPHWNLGNVGGRGYSVPSIADLRGAANPPPPPPPPPPETDKMLSLARGKFVFHYHGVSDRDTYGPGDYATIQGYLQNSQQETFTLPLDKDVTVTIEMPDPADRAVWRDVWKQKIPAGTVPEGGNYRFTSSNPGITDLEFSKYSSTAVAVYLELHKIYWFSDYKPEPPDGKTCPGPGVYWVAGCVYTPLEYLNEIVLPTSTFRVTIDIDGTVWKGQGTLKRDNYNEHYQYLAIVPS